MKWKESRVRWVMLSCDNSRGKSFHKQLQEWDFVYTNHIWIIISEVISDVFLKRIKELIC